ncbi:polymorphic toxin-type HINT domain-containing protein [Actinomadura keratinilytica]
MGDGSLKPIDQIKVGDKVLATDPVTGETGPRTVLTTFGDSGTKDMVRVTVDTDGERGTKTGTLQVTDNHPFWIPALNQWVDAGKLKPGMWLRTSAGTHVQITAVDTWTRHQQVHNLTVESDHTYYAAAGTTPVLVHNCPPSGQAVIHAHTEDGGNIHFTIEVMDSAGNVRHTHLMPTADRMQTPISDYTGPSGPIQVTFNLPDARAALAYQAKVVDTGQGPYSWFQNSCLTHCADVLRAGGVTDLPENGKRLIVWAKRGMNSEFRAF